MKNSKSTSSSKCFVLKGGLYTLTTLHLQHYDLPALNEQLANTVSQAPKFFDHTPVVVDLQTLAENTTIDMTELASNLRAHNLIPVGIRGGNEEQKQEALKSNWAVLPETAKSETADSNSATVAHKHTLTKLITQPVRSGQQIYAQGGDLIVLAPVSAGAEILADGHIHVYAPLRGRALAGVLGNPEARIFCQHLEAELIAIAGNYKVSEQLKDHISAWEKSVSIYLTDEHLTIQPL